MKRILFATAILLSIGTQPCIANDVTPAAPNKTELKNYKSAVCNTPAGMHNRDCANAQAQDMSTIPVAAAPTATPHP